MSRLSQRKLANGFTVICDPFLSLTAGVALAVIGGYRDDQGRPGGSHALEHKLWRSTRLHPTGMLFARHWERFTPMLHAETDKSSVVFHCEVSRRHIRSAIRLMAEIARHPTFPAEQVRKETERLQAERGDEEDSPETRLNEVLDRLMFAGDGLGRSVDRGHATVGQFRPAELRTLYRQKFVGRRLALIVSGGFARDLVEPLITRLFSDLPAGTTHQSAALNYRQLRGGIRLTRAECQKLTFLIGFPTFGFDQELPRIALGVIRNHFSSRITSRLGMQLDAAGFVYSSTDSLWFWRDVGQYYFQVPLFPEKFSRALEIIAAELNLLRAEGVTTDDLDHAKHNLAMEAGVRFTKPEDAAPFYGRGWVNCGGASVLSVPRYRRALGRVDCRLTRRVARMTFTNGRLVLVAHGPIPKLTKAQIRSLLRLR